MSNKNIKTMFKMSYPAMSIYEFESLKNETEVLEWWKDSSIYLICQRKVLYFDEITISNGVVNMKIKERGDQDNILNIIFDSSLNEKYFQSETEYLVELQFFDEVQQIEQPFQNCAGIKFLTQEKEFLFWLTPERMLFEYLRGVIKITIDGCIDEFLNYKLHYIGQAQKQSIWKRLTGHEKLLKILSTEHPLIFGEFSPYELSLIFLKLETVDSFSMIDPKNYENEVAFTNAVEEITTFQFEDIKVNAINDFEAFFINFFKPKYNEILFENYPDIKNGFNAIGIANNRHEYFILANLFTDEASHKISITPIYDDNDL